MPFLTQFSSVIQAKDQHQQMILFHAVSVAIHPHGSHRDGYNKKNVRGTTHTRGIKDEEKVSDGLDKHVGEETNMLEEEI